MDQVSSFKYLGSFLTEDWRCEKDGKARIEIAKEAFTRKKKDFVWIFRIRIKEEIREVFCFECTLVWC